jgi:hypothetical protein
MADNVETPQPKAKFDFSAYPPDSLFHERRDGKDRRADGAQAPRPILVPETATETPRTASPILRREKKERRKRIDPTTFEKQYTDDELEFMNAMQRFKVRSGKTFPSHGEVLAVARSLGYRRLVGNPREAVDSGDEDTVLAEVGPIGR